jgi:hypothetical protein
MPGFFIKRENLDTDMQTGRMPCEQEGKDLCGKSVREGTPKTASKAAKLGERHGKDSSSWPSEGPV